MRRLVLLFLLLFSSCRPGQETPTPHLPDSSSSVVMHTVTPAWTPDSQSPGVPTATIVPATPQPYEQYTIDALRARTYGEGTIEVIETMEANGWFTRYLVRYPSDGLRIYGFVNVPKGEGPFPVIVAIHGFVDPATYDTLDYTAPAADGLAQAGYVVFHPNLRGYPPSDSGDDLFRVGMAVDVLNLIALIKARAGAAELFTSAATGHIGLWGHSMGGNIALRVLTVTADIQAAVLYASMSGDETRNTSLLSSLFPDPVFQTELAAPPLAMQRISPMYYYREIISPIQLQHGTADQTVPVSWAEETCSLLTDAGVQVECIYYPGEDHTFRSRVANQFDESVLGFYAAHLSS